MVAVTVLVTLALAMSASGGSASQSRSRIVLANNEGLSTIDAGGGGRQVVLGRETLGPDCPGNPKWSPDGSWIAYSCNFRIWVVRPDGSGNRMLSALRSGVPSWSADGRAVYFTGIFGGVRHRNRRSKPRRRRGSAFRSSNRRRGEFRAVVA